MNAKMPKNHHLLAFALIASIGAAVGAMFTTKKGKKIQKEIIAQARKIAKKFKGSRTVIRKNVKEVFGEFNEMLEENYIEVQAYILAKVEEAKAKADFDEKKYNKIVDDIVKNFAKAKKWSAKTSVKLKKNFKKYWKEIK